MKPQLSLNCVFVPDEETKGFSAFFEEFPDTFAQGSTKKEALENLLKLVSALLATMKDNSIVIANSVRETITLQYA